MHSELKHNLSHVEVQHCDDKVGNENKIHVECLQVALACNSNYLRFNRLCDAI